MRVFEIDLDQGPNCAGASKMIAAFPEAPVVEHIVTCQGLQAQALPRAPARGRRLQVA
jgi:hypothetical protein